MRLTIIQHGRLRDAHITALRDEYLKRFRRFGTLDVVEREPRGERVLWPEVCRWRVLLDERGTTYTSERLAAQLQEWSMRHGPIAFVVGDAYGHHPPTAAMADARWALSTLTLPHQLAHLLAIEQLYRAATIINRTPYHHA